MGAIKFKCKGHKNITARHKTTIEFTKSGSLTLRGDCILGVNSDFSLERIKNALEWKNVKLLLNVDGITEEINGEINSDFSDDNEIVIRKSGFISKRTLVIKADKACSDLKKEFIDRVKDPLKTMRVRIERWDGKE